MKAVGAELNIEPMIIKGEDLEKQGFGGNSSNFYHFQQMARNTMHLPKLVLMVPNGWGILQCPIKYALRPVDWGK